MEFPAGMTLDDMQDAVDRAESSQVDDPAGFIALRVPFRRSADAWAEFCAGLKPGHEMDACVEWLVHGTEQFCQYPGSLISPYSTQYDAAFSIAVDENDYLSIRDIMDDTRHHVAWECTVEWREFIGNGRGERAPEAVARALLDMYQPNDQELGREAS